MLSRIYFIQARQLIYGNSKPINRSDDDAAGEKLPDKSALSYLVSRFFVHRCLLNASRKFRLFPPACDQTPNTHTCCALALSRRISILANDKCILLSVKICLFSYLKHFLEQMSIRQAVRKKKGINNWIEFKSKPCVLTIRTTKRTKFIVFRLTITMSQRQYYLAFVSGEFETKPFGSRPEEFAITYLRAIMAFHSFSRILTKSHPTVITINRFANDIIAWM